MKKFIYNAIILIAIALSTTGCVQTLDGGVEIPGSSKVEENKSVKLYYKDNNKEAVEKDSKNIADFINNTEIKPRYWYAAKNVSDASFYDRFDYVGGANTENKVLNIKLTLESDEKTIGLVANKKYTSRNEAYQDFHNIRQIIFEKISDNRKNAPSIVGDSDFADKIGTTWSIYPDEYALDKGLLKIYTKKELIRQAYSERTETAFKKSGYTLVENPIDADKVIIFEISRDYYQSEIKKLQKEGKNLNFGVLNTSTNQVNKMETAMNLSSMSGNSSGTAAGVGIGAGILFSIIDMFNDKNIAIPTFKITYPKENKSYLFLPNLSFESYDNRHPITQERRNKFLGTQFYFQTLRAYNERDYDDRWKLIPLN